MNKIWIPRNLNNSDHIKLLGLRFNISDIPFMFVAIVIAYLLTESVVNIFIIIMIFSFCISFAYLVNHIKFYNQTILELLFNKMLYMQRQKLYKRGL